MPNSRQPDVKLQALRQTRTVNAKAEQVSDPLFQQHAFFDPRDVVQVKYEMLRRVQAEGVSVGRAAAAFGFSRVSFYQASKRLAQSGLGGLLPRPRGPKRSHKLSGDVMRFVEQQLTQDSSLRAAGLADQVRERFGLSVHPRSIERALARRQKKGRHGRAG